MVSERLAQQILPPIVKVLNIPGEEEVQIRLDAVRLERMRALIEHRQGSAAAFGHVDGVTEIARHDNVFRLIHNAERGVGPAHIKFCGRCGLTMN